MWSNSTDTILHVEVVDKPQQLQSTGKHALVVCTAKEVSQIKTPCTFPSPVASCCGIGQSELSTMHRRGLLPDRGALHHQDVLQSSPAGLSTCGVL